MITGTYEPYHTTELRFQEMMPATINSRDAAADLEMAKQIDITCCSRIGHFRHNYARPISVTFLRKDDKESLLSNKRNLPTGVFANEEYPLHIKQI